MKENLSGQTDERTERQMDDLLNIMNMQSGLVIYLSANRRPENSPLSLLNF